MIATLRATARKAAGAISRLWSKGQIHASYNVGPGRPGTTVRTEILTVLLRGKVKRLGLQEVIGYRLDQITGYELVRSMANDGRKNIAAYVRKRRGMKVTHHWVDLKETWARTEHHGVHPPRSILVVRIETRFGFVSWLIVGHAPPKTRSGDSRAARKEHFDAIVAAALGKSNVAIVMDANAVADEEFGAFAIAKALGGITVGRRIDTAVVVGGTSSDEAYLTSVAGVPMRTDHGHIFVFPVRWIRTHKEKP